jgi:hypothetical protein
MREREADREADRERQRLQDIDSAKSMCMCRSIFSSIERSHSNVPVMGCCDTKLMYNVNIFCPVRYDYYAIS